MQYEIKIRGLANLLADRPYLTGGRKDLVGRNYGWVSQDPGAPDRIVLLAGTSTQSVFSDLIQGKLVTDPWAGIERHISVYNLRTNLIQDRFFSYAHDNNDGNKYQNRVVFPANGLIATGRGASRLAYSVYVGGRWYFHISQPGSTVDKYRLKDTFLWDVRDLDGDGKQEIIVSPTRYPNQPDVPGYYFPKWETRVYHWQESTLRLLAKKTYKGAIPYLRASFRKNRRTSSQGFLYPALTAWKQNKSHLVLYTPQKQISLQSIP